MIKTEEILHKEKSQQIVGCAMEVLNHLGHGFHEKPYENALVVEFENLNVPYQQQQHFDITYKSSKVGEYIPDLIAFNQIIIDTKVIEKITNLEVGQMMNYLKIANLQLGYIINFKHPKLEWQRVIR